MSPTQASPTLFFAHYFGGSARSWRGVIQALGDDVRCVCVDLAGFGGTAPPQDDLSLDAYVDQVEAAAGDGPWIVVGHSMGGKVALAAATRHPANLKGLVLIAPSPPTPEPMTEADRRKFIGEFGDRTAAHAHINQITDGSLTDAVFEACVEDEVSVARSAWLWWLEQGSRTDISSHTAEIRLPILVLAGDADTVLGLETPRQVANGLAGAKMEVIPGGGHLVPLEQPDLVAGLIKRFLAEQALAA